jgi:hypothetical protein
MRRIITCALLALLLFLPEIPRALETEKYEVMSAQDQARFVSPLDGSEQASKAR